MMTICLPAKCENTTVCQESFANQRGRAQTTKKREPRLQVNNLFDLNYLELMI